MKKLFIFGAGGAGRELLEVIEYINTPQKWELSGFSDADARKIHSCCGYPVITEDELLHYNEPVDVVISVALPSAREKIFNKLSRSSNINFPTIINPATEISKRAKISDGVVVGANCHICTDVVIGKCVFINGLCAVGHDAVIGDFSSIMTFSLIAGNTKIGKRVFIGAGSNIVQGLSVGSDSIICAGSVVMRNVGEGEKVIGNPAKVIDKLIRVGDNYPLE